MNIPWIAIIGPIVLVWIAAYILYKLITEHINERFDDLKKWMKENQ